MARRPKKRARAYVHVHWLSIIGCPVIQVHPLRMDSLCSYKVKINKAHLWHALSSQEGYEHRVRLWKSFKPPHRIISPQAGANQYGSPSHSGRIHISSWNCRGFGSSEPYLKSLSNSSDFILLQEHWLWPFDLHKLSSVLEGFSSTGKCDERLNESSSLRRGCGGVAILWRKSIYANPICLGIKNDCICAVEVSLRNSALDKLVIYNIYCPSSDADHDHFSQCILDLEAEINSHDNETTAIVIAGDFNAHLGTLAGPRGSGPPNRRGITLKEFIDRNNLFVPSHSLVSTGPSYTFHSGGTFSTIDYILTNKASTDLLDKCKGIPDHPLNVSDHLPLSISLQVSSLKGKCTSPTPKIHWEKAVTTGAISAYEQSVNDFISPLLGSSCDDLAQLEQEVLSVSEAICKCADSLLPKCSSNRRPRRDFYNDGHLKLLCNLSKSSWKEWKNGGRPQSGDLLVNKIAAKKKVQTRLNQLRARKDRLHSEHIDDNFRARDNKRFRSPRDGTPSGSRLQVNNNIITCPDDVMSAWVTHFETLGSSKVQESPLLQQLQSTIPLLHSLSLNNEDYVLDVPITIEEIEGAIAKLKRGKSSGPDGILPEHIIYGGSALRRWLKRIFTTIIDLEAVPPSLLNAITVPIYKGKGKNPLLTNNYRGISLTSVIGKLFERILLLRLTPVLEENGIPHHTQTAYQAGISCADPTEVVQEAVKNHIQHGSVVYQCFYDLEKAFDSVEYCVLLDHLYRSGINGKAWRLIRSFYHNLHGQVRIDGQLSKSLSLQRGVRQGSVLSPMLFLLVMDALLTELVDANAGLSVNGIYTGSLGHADDLRSITSNLVSLQKQAEIVKAFTEKNSLTLNAEKLELLAMTNGSLPQENGIQIGSNLITPSSSARCLGVIWSHDLSPKESIEFNISKARRAFFAQGSLGIYQGKQNPLTASEVFETCVLPVCLYGCENWLLTDPLLALLEDFQSEIGKRILNLPRHHANLCPLIGLQWPSMRLRVLHRKLGFLWRLMFPHHSSISVEVFNSMKDQLPGPLIVQQCKFLEQAYRTNFTSSILKGDITSIRPVKKALTTADQDLIWAQISQKNSLRSMSRTISWPKLWDLARDRGIQGARSLSAIFKVLTTPIFDERKCHHCDIVITRDVPYSDHIARAHLLQPLADIIALLEEGDEEVFAIGSELKRLNACSEQSLIADVT